MKQLGMLLLILVAASAACNLSADAGGNPTPIALNGGGAVLQPIDDADDAQQDDGNTDADDAVVDDDTASDDDDTTNDNTSNSGGAGNVNPIQTCTIRTDWPTYAVQPGDTLSAIARRANTTTDVLISANCLTNPNLLEVGQLLRVPQIPVPAIPNIGPIEVWPAEILGSGGGVTYLVTQGATVGINANVDAAERVDFYARFSDGVGTVQFLGTDHNLRDGGSLTWVAPTNGIGELAVWAEAIYNSNQSVRSNEARIRWEPNQYDKPQLGGLSITPAEVWSSGEIVVTSGTTVTITTPAVNATRVDYYTAPTGTGMTPTQIGVDTAPAADVSSIQWTVPANHGAMHIWAEATNARGEIAVGEIRMLVWREHCTNDWFFTFSEQVPPFACPLPVQSVAVIAQDFEGGRIFRYPIPSTDGQAYYLVVYNNGRWEHHVDTWDGTPVDTSDFTPPAEREVPVGGIGYLWRNDETLRANLGWAFSAQEEFLGRFQYVEGIPENQLFPPQFPGWSIYIDYGKSGLVLNLIAQSAGNGGSQWGTVGYYE